MKYYWAIDMDDVGEGKDDFIMRVKMKRKDYKTLMKRVRVKTNIMRRRKERMMKEKMTNTTEH